MDHRYFPRIRVSLEIDLFKRNELIGHAQTKDISLGGMRLQNEELVLKRNNLIALRLWMNGVEQTLRALVIYANRQYAGVMLIDMTKEASHAYFHFLNELEAPKNIALATLDCGINTFRERTAS